MGRLAAVPAILLASGLAWMVGCLDGTGLRTSENLLGLIVSAPFRGPIGATRVAGSGASTFSANVVYVALPPGSVPAGVRATITNQASGLFVTTAVVDGGFDPVPLAASVGDTLVTEIADAASATLNHVRLAVSSVRPLKVVRTSPPSGGRDVPLNATIVIVFSEPVDPASVDSRSVRLWRDTTPVPGTVRVGDGYHTTADFHPADLLARLTAYGLTASPDIRSLSGQALGSPVDVGFTTGVSVQAQAAAKLAFTVQPSSTTAGVAISPAVTVTIQDTAGNTVASATNPVTLASSCAPSSACDSARSSPVWGGLSGTIVVQAVNGVATFRDLWLPSATTGYTLTASTSTLAGATSAPFDIAPGPPVLLHFEGVNNTTMAQPSAVAHVAIKDSFLNTVTSARDAVTLTLAAHPAGATLAGTLTVTAANGVASFANLSLDRPGSYTLAATAGTLTGATSNLFLVYAGAGSFVQVTAGGTHTCGQTYAGVWYCWGRNDHGQLGDGTTTDRTSPVPVAGGQSFNAVMAGGSHTCGLTAGGRAYCWGLNDHGQLGDGTTTDRTSPVAVAGSLTFLSLSAGSSHTCGFTGYPSTEVGLVSCWGSNASGQLGDGTTVDSPTPQTIAGITLFGPMVSAGGQHTCGLYWDVGVDYCWGSNTRGQLDNGTTFGATSPVPMTGVACGSGPPGFVLPPGLTCPPGATTGFEAVAAGGYYTCAEAGGAYFESYAWYCWGANENGQLGDGTTVDRASPALVGGGMPFVPENGVSAGAQHTCGVSATGTYPSPIPAGAYCWGLNSSGQLGDGTTTQRMSPVPVTGGLSFVSVSAGGSHTCAVSPTGAYCWGANGSGQLGAGTTTNSSVPVKVAGQP